MVEDRHALQDLRARTKGLDGRSEQTEDVRRGKRVGVPFDRFEGPGGLAVDDEESEPGAELHLLDELVDRLDGRDAGPLEGGADQVECCGGRRKGEDGERDRRVDLRLQLPKVFPTLKRRTEQQISALRRQDSRRSRQTF